MNNPYNVMYFFKVSKSSGNIESVEYLPFIATGETDSSFFVPACTYSIQEYENKKNDGPVAINDLIPGSFAKKTKR